MTWQLLLYLLIAGGLVSLVFGIAWLVFNSDYDDGGV
jgi:hypothetical protein